MTLLNRLAPGLMLLSMLVVGCDTVVQEPATPPSLIPAQAFTVQTELFDQAQSGEDEIGTDAMIARLRVWPLTTALAEYLTLPAAVTEAALEEEPVVEGYEWVWKATVTNGDREVRFALSGVPRGEHVDWTMRVTKSPSATESPLVSEEDSTFVLYTATTVRDGTSGSWQLFSPAEDSTINVLDAEFEIGKENKKEVTFQVTEAAREHTGDSVVYAREGDQRSFHWMQDEGGREHRIVWDAKSHAGSITATNYNDGQKACWGEALQNVECSH